jgi:hypothetical protein
MRPIVLGLIAAAIAAVLPAAAFADPPPGPAPKPPPISKENRDAGMKEAPKLVAAANLPCDVADARFIGTTQEPKLKQPSKFYEVACKGSMGFIIVDRGTGQPGWAACPEQSRVDATGKPYLGGCYLPENMDDNAAIAPFVAATKIPCTPQKVRGIGHTQQADYFEVLCQSGHGYILQTSAPPKPDQPVQMLPCLFYTDAASLLSCKLTTRESQLALIDQLAAQTGKCQVKDRRYILTTPKYDNYYEVACQDGKGYVLHESPDGKLAEAPIDCAVADQIGGGCTLTNARQAQTEERALYSDLSKKAGFACDVAKYGPINVDMPGHEVVELACSNRPDGAIGIFPTDPNTPGLIYDCAHAEVAAYRCSFTEASASYGKLTDDLKKLGKTSCAVSGEQSVGISDDHLLGYLEVACADGNPGYIVSYNLPAMTPKEAIACAFAKNINGGCQLPTNKPKGG